ncbi:inibitor of reinitiation of DNA replication [Gammaproteobacteria bacterium]
MNSSDFATGKQLPLRFKVREGTTFDDYLPGPNCEAVDLLRRDSEPYAYLWGAEGVGKSHLLQAACRTREAAAYLPLGELLDHDSGVLEGLETLSLVCLDDLERVAGNEAWERALCDLYNRLREAGVPLRAAGNAAPSALGLTLADLVSRLGWGPIYHLQELDDSDKATALRQRAHSRGLDLPEEVARYLLRHQPRDNASLFKLLDHLDQASLAAQRRLTIPFVRTVLTT